MTATLSYSFAKAHGVLLETEGGTPLCRHLPGATLSALMEAQRIAGRPISFDPIEADRFDQALSAAYRNSASEAASIAGGDSDDLSALAETAASVDDLLDQKDDAPVVRLINALLLEAVKDGASDIHIEVEEKRLVVRFRVDGVLREVLSPRRALAAQLSSRLKVMGKLDIAEKRLPQDGRVSLRVGNYELDVRISTLPSQFGERVVLRLLDRGHTQTGIDNLGLTLRDREVFEQIIHSPEGLVLVTGPTGSGKTTSLYAALHALNDRERNILTVEDPIEYSMDGVGQIQVNAKTEMTFARGLRAILRQDPDVIMVGEIRDGETARIAVESAMTGHLVLSTLHTNTAIGAVSRLIDMGVERYLLAPMLRGLVAQRLVRRLCPDCRTKRTLTEAEGALLSGTLEPGTEVWDAQGCDACGGTGYRGRLAVYEIIAMTSLLETMIHEGASEAELTAEARKSAPSILQDGVANIRDGLTTVSEVARVVREDVVSGDR
ncbi:Flp pilus assembly complex ATPase component TadA [Sulfitobacter mediterraneus]|uniref:GspE/PulE family protein n=1 Tax=Sulfitobacter mediterraneus TaxID=83219 RepID=UPI0019337746|nr:ATPase, T2SS/T4P/T4SS family [Sulfitobacter mediterraneus]MBM1635194.1 Flp pilus assembly complex ATPase component TadA [Sulfitobacter mediterraneus]MBM1643045.1 Flp pilus assembly complex ATPase component TadA [Sulfitobacter mediterraneus]MBM1647093.1 Flp pilus assembly complex ATPase component TadA [Sulfitobacter mediterraneus]MBM1651135.1 Flp pilus assembly complex ATPase component TadA [Sulfitobacter mediterraneus]MBM1655138.1 Flp pilus assembly complex ATPase component TadA [Sulfitobac